MSTNPNIAVDDRFGYVAVVVIVAIISEAAKKELNRIRPRDSVAPLIPMKASVSAKITAE